MAVPTVTALKQRTQALAAQAQNFNSMNDAEKQSFINQVKQTQSLMKSHLDGKWSSEPHPQLRAYQEEMQKHYSTYPVDVSWRSEGPEADRFREENKVLVSLLGDLEKLETTEEMNSETLALKQRLESLIPQISTYSGMSHSQKGAYEESVQTLYNDVKNYLDTKWGKIDHPPTDSRTPPHWTNENEIAVKFRERNKTLVSALPVLNNIKDPNRTMYIEVHAGRAIKPQHVSVSIKVATAKLQDLKIPAATAFKISADTISPMNLNGETNENRYLREIIKSEKDVAWFR